jgi:enoyl-CoA hydratase/carnithine racemase
VTLNRPAALNSLSLALAEELAAAIEAAEADATVRACILTGAGRAFCAGADLLAIGDGTGGQTLAERLNLFLPPLGQAFNRIETSRLPIIAAVNGLTLAGGLELVLCSRHCRAPGQIWRRPCKLRPVARRWRVGSTP